MRSWAEASGARSSSRRLHRMSGSRRSVPRPEQGASSRTRSNGRVKGSGCSASAWTIRTIVAPLAATVRFRRSMRFRLTSHATTQSAVRHRRRHGRRLAARRRAGVEHPQSRRGIGQQGDELRRFILHDEPAIGQAEAMAAADLEGLAFFDDQRVRREAPRRDPDIFSCQPFGELGGRELSGDWRAASAAPARC